MMLIFQIAPFHSETRRVVVSEKQLLNDSGHLFSNPSLFFMGNPTSLKLVILLWWKYRTEIHD